MPKLKYNEKKNSYKLKLSHDALMLITKLASHIRLGSGNRYSDAAMEINELISNFDEGLYDEARRDITFQVGVENDEGQYSVTVNGEDCSIDVY